MNNPFFLGRQPILDREEKLFAYGLTFCPTESLPHCSTTDGLLPLPMREMLSETGAEEILGERTGVITMDMDLFMNDSLESLPSNRVILSLDENIPLNKEVIRRCHHFKESGFTLALESHPFHPELEDLYRIIDIIRVDPNLVSTPRMKEMVQQLHRQSVRLLAKNVETRQQYTQYRELGFDFFQGFFFAHPAVVARKKLDESTAGLLRILHLILNDAELEAIVHTFQESPALTYKLLIQANSAVIGVRREIESVRHAISLLGRDQIRRWVQMELLSSSGSQEQDNPLVEMATVRASFLEQLSKSHPMLRGFKDAADRAFLVGTLSMMESIYNVSIQDVVKSVELSSDVKMALLRRSGLFGDMLTFVEALERLDFPAAGKLLPKIKISPAKILDAQRNSFAWNKVV